MKVVCLNPSHGGSDTGVTCPGIEEKDINLEVALKVGAYLKNYKVHALFTRETDKSLTMENRAKIAAENKAEVLLDIHFNVYKEKDVNGFETFISPMESAIAQKYQEIIHRWIYSYVGTLGIADRGRKFGNYNLLNMCYSRNVVGILLQYLYISNPPGAKLAKDGEVLDKLSYYTAEGIVKAMNLHTS